MGIVYPDFTTISKLRTQPTIGEYHLLRYLSEKLDSSYEVFFNPFLDGDRPEIIILKKNHGAIIIEVKDWNLSSYLVDRDNKWRIRKKKEQSILSPQQQAFRYKQNFFELHLPILGMAEAFNSNFYKTVYPFVYFHNSKVADINNLYFPALSGLATERTKLNNQRKESIRSQKEKEQRQEDKEYEKKYDSLSQKIKKLERDKAMSFSTDSLEKLKKRLDNITTNKLFSEEIYDDFKRRLTPSEWTYTQGEKIELDAKQEKYAKSADVFTKIHGVAWMWKNIYPCSKSFRCTRKAWKCAYIDL